MTIDEYLDNEIQHFGLYLRQLQSLPEDLRAVADAVRPHKVSLIDHDERQAVITAEITRQVEDERDDGGKPVYPNAQSRATEVASRLAQHDEYRELSRKIEDDKAAINQAYRDQDRIKMQHASAIALVNLATEYLRNRNMTAQADEVEIPAWLEED
jgi:hypothetical protein